MHLNQAFRPAKLSRKLKRVHKKTDKGIERIVDANLNRAKEGLRVCEDIFRFVFEHTTLTGDLKKARHQLSTIFDKWQIAQAIQSRDAGRDIGRGTNFEKYQRKNTQDIFYANIQRVKESIRVLEEFAKLAQPKAAKNLKRLRYRIYELEQVATAAFKKR